MLGSQNHKVGYPKKGVRYEPLQVGLELPSGMCRVDSKKLRHGCRRTHAGLPSFVGLGLEEGHVLTFCRFL